MFDHAYPLEYLQTICSGIGLVVNSFTWMVARVDLRYAERATPYEGDRVLAGRTRVRREWVSMVWVQGMMFALGMLSLAYPPPPWPWDVQGIPLPWRELTAVQRSALLYAWIWRVGISTMCLRKAINSLQNWFEEQPLRTYRRFNDPPSGYVRRAQLVAESARRTSEVAGAAAAAAEKENSAP